MIGKLVPLFAIIGLTVAVGVVILGNQAAPVAPPVVRLPNVPFTSYVAGAGLVQASTENIAIGTPVSGIVTAIYVKWGDWVNAGAPLLKIDDRDLQGQLLVAVAKVKAAEASLAKAKSVLDFSQRVTPGEGISRMEMGNRRLDVSIGEAALALAKAEVEQMKIEIDRRTIRAPVSGRVLQMETHLGEFAQSGVLSTPLMLFGDDARLHVRVHIDENDAWRVHAGASAMAFLPGNPDLSAPLRFERVEPYVEPKVSLTGHSTERTDTRVLPVIYSFDPAVLPVYVGQQVDVFIEAAPLPLATARAQSPSGNTP
jgi:HlyD family secretion protein